MKKKITLELIVDVSNYEGRYVNPTELENKLVHDIEGLADDSEYPESMRDGAVDKIEVRHIKTEKVT